jgi:L,D-peptidoglycan transpeptidase YkuD (ErfK/YbiS/YcfS/YnhG family)
MRIEAKSVIAVSCLLLACLLPACLVAACGPAAPPASPAPPAALTPEASPAAVRAVGPATPAAARPITAPARALRCPRYPAATYGIDPNQVPDTGGGAQLVTVVAPSTTGWAAATLTAWARGANGCWSPASFAGQPAQPFRAQTGQGGLLPFSQRVPGDYATPIGLFPFGTTIYGNSMVSPSTRYPYHHLVCGDWWDEQPGSPTYDSFEHVPCPVTPAYGEDSEALWTEVQPYQHFIDIEMPHPPDNGAGIFLHDDMPEGYTEGCVALPNAELDAVLGWLNPDAAPHILIAVR